MDRLDLLAIQGILKSFLQHHSSKASILQCSAFFMDLCMDSHIHTWLLEKTIALTRQIFVGKVTSLLFTMLPRFVTAFLPRSKCLLISWLQSPSAVILEPKKIVCHGFHCFPIYLPWSDGTGSHDLSFWSFFFFSQPHFRYCEKEAQRLEQLVHDQAVGAGSLHSFSEVLLLLPQSTLTGPEGMLTGGERGHSSATHQSERLALTESLLCLQLWEKALLPGRGCIESLSFSLICRNEFRAWTDIKPVKPIKAKPQYKPPDDKMAHETSYSAQFKGEANKPTPADNKVIDRRRIRSLYSEPFKEPPKVRQIFWGPISSLTWRG